MQTLHCASFIKPTLNC